MQNKGKSKIVEEANKKEIKSNLSKSRRNNCFQMMSSVYEYLNSTDFSDDNLK
jgi:hypothetical protein